LAATSVDELELRRRDADASLRPTASMRVLHMIDPGLPGGGACALRLLAEPLLRLDSVRQDVLIVGTGRHEALARRCGIRPLGHICPPCALPLMGVKSLRRLLGAKAAQGDSYDLIHAWTPRAAAIAGKAAPRLPVLATFHVGPVGGFQVSSLWRIANKAKIHFMAGSLAVQREYRGLGFGARQMALLPPAVNLKQSELNHRAEVRQRWAESCGMNERAFVIGLLCEPVTWPDVRALAGVAARLRLSGRDVRLVVHHSASRRTEAERYLSQIGMRDLLIVDDAVAEPWRVVSGLDAALLFGGPDAGFSTTNGSWFVKDTCARPFPSVLPLLWAFAAGVPVVAEDTDAARGVIENGLTGFLVNRHDVNAATDQLARWHDDRATAGRVGAAAQHAVRDLFHIDAYCVRLQHAYDLLLADRHVQRMPISGGHPLHGEKEPSVDI
jgi:glycosyltransferase involved in cell wall biosynthesis